MNTAYFQRLACALVCMLVSATCCAGWLPVSAEMSYQSARPVFDRINRVYVVTVTVTNQSNHAIEGPMRLMVHEPSIPMMNASGETDDGVPYLNMAATTMQPAESVRVNLSFALQRKAITFTPALQVDSPWDLVWQDEFDGDSIDLSKWSHEVDCNGGGNNEKQCYTDAPDNSFVQDGLLNIVAQAAEGQPLPYSSARLRSLNKGDWTYGRIEVRAKPPVGQGSWPAIWMLPSDNVYGGWPNSGEIDIFESVNLGVPHPQGGVENHVHGTLHYGRLWPNNDNSGLSYALPDGSNPADDFHVYSLEWEEGEMRWYVDDVLYQTQRMTEVNTIDGVPHGIVHRGWYTEENGQLRWDTAPYDQRFHMILNFAVGGAWPEAVNQTGIDASAFNASNPFQIDYVRVYECSVAPVTGKGCNREAPGYDAYLEDGGTLNTGAAPVPIRPSTGIAEDLNVIIDSENPHWPMWISASPTDPVVVTDEDVAHDQVAQFTFGPVPAVAGFNIYESEVAIPYDGSPMAGNGVLMFDLKLVQAPLSNTSSWFLKVEQAGNSSAAEVPIPAPTSEWQSYSLPLRDLRGAGLALNGIDVIMVFPAWGQGDGAIYRIDNVQIVEGEVPPPPEEVVLFDNGTQSPWTLWDCCGNATVGEVSDGARGIVAEVNFFGAAGTVSGFTTAGSVDVSGAAGKVLEFDLKMTSEPNNPSSVWLIKVEDANQNFYEYPLSTSLEGLDPTLDTWQRFTFEVAALEAAGVNLQTLKNVLIFPAWQTAQGAMYRIDNVRFGDASAPLDTGGDEPPPAVDPVPVDFEGAAESYVFNNFDGGVSTVIPNPVPASGYDSAQVVQMQKFAGQPWGGTTLTLADTFNVEDTVFTLDVYSERAVNVLFKLEALGQERNVGHSGSGWETLQFDFAGTTGGLLQITLIFDLGVMGDALADPQNWTFFYDNIAVQTDDPDNLLTNGGFEDGITGWSGGSVIDEDGNNVFMAPVTQAGNPWDVNLSQVLSIVPGATYELVFRAKASVARNIIVGIGFNHPPWSANVEDASLGLDWQTYTFVLSAVDDGTGASFGDDDSRVIFDMGAAVGTVYLDDVVLKLVE